MATLNHTSLIMIIKNTNDLVKPYKAKVPLHPNLIVAGVDAGPKTQYCGIHMHTGMVIIRV